MFLTLLAASSILVVLTVRFVYIICCIGIFALVYFLNLIQSLAKFGLGAEIIMDNVETIKEVRFFPVIFRTF